MARGWESKSVESQIDDGAVAPEKRRALTEDEIELAHRRSSIVLSRTRVARELESATSSVHRTALEYALSYLDGELKKLDNAK